MQNFDKLRTLWVDHQFVHKVTSDETGLFRIVSLVGEVNDPVVLHAAAEARKISLDTGDDEKVVLNHFILVFVPNGDWVNIISTAVADVTNEELSLGFSVSDVITSIEALALGEEGITSLFTFATISVKVVDIESRTTAAESESSAASILSGVEEDLFIRFSVVNSPLVWAAA